MEQEIKAISVNQKSANLSMTEEYLVVKGQHYNVFNGYVSPADKSQAIRVKDILNMEFVTMRSKRLFMAFITLMSLVTLSFPALRYMLNIVNENREIAKKAYEQISHLDIKTVFVIVVIVYILMLAACVYIFWMYFFKPFKLLRISTVGIMLAVERKYYDETELNALMKAWKKHI